MIWIEPERRNPMTGAVIVVGVLAILILIVIAKTAMVVPQSSARGVPGKS